ncbi:hypothetical protein RRG08_024472 [Elysia crispata]|uniref:Uncharacterized protein n=1 Tax=Elysia crispata TaxID=231223 RepID=A0AAE1D232_9GAST|nr:hypothetical protein RRG08_024472 [Elysia crispata]
MQEKLRCPAEDRGLQLLKPSTEHKSCLVTGCHSGASKHSHLIGRGKNTCFLFSLECCWGIPPGHARPSNPATALESPALPLNS